MAGALAEGVGLAAAGAGFAVFWALFFPFLATVAQEGAPTGAGAGGGGTGNAVVVVVDGPGVDPGVLP